MPRKTTTAAAAPASLPPAAAPQSMPIGPEPADWSDVLGELQGDATTEVHVYAEPDKGQGGAAWCFSCSPEDYTWSQLLDRIKADPDLGPGRYSLRAKRGSQFVGSKRIQIAGRPRPAVAVVAPAPTAPPPAERQSEFLEKLVLALIARPVQESKGGGISDVIEAAKLLTEGRTERNPVKELKEVLELRDLLREPKPEGEGDAAPVGATMADLILEAVRTFGRPIAALAGADSPAPPAASAPPPAIAAPAPTPAPKPAAKPAAGGANQLKQMIGLMLRGAANGSSPEAYAELALDLMGDDNAALLLQQPDPLALIVGLDARVQPHREWFAEVLQAARELLSGEAPGGLTGAETGADGAAHDPAAPESGNLAEA